MRNKASFPLALFAFIATWQGSLHLWPLYRHIAQTKEEIADIVAKVRNNT
ncbi:hypothetical protein [Phyllobacterium zundukense]|nr:hypothetical protein [Phyllobacterium zundukense]